jgi:hypothetical protein
MLWLNYCALRRYEEADKIQGRLSALEPDKPLHKIERPFVAFLRTGDATSYRAALDRLPSSMKDHGRIGSERFWFSLYARDWAATSQILGQAPGEDLYFGDNVKVAVPRGCGEIWFAALRGQHPTMEGGFGTARDQLAQRVEAHPEAPELLSVLGAIDAFLGRKQDAIQEATRAAEIQPISKDTLEGTYILQNLAIVYAWTNESSSAFEQLAILVKTPGAMFYGQLKLDPAFDPIRQDPRFEKLLAKMRTTDSCVRARRAPPIPGPTKISVARLPVTGSNVFGREEDMGKLCRRQAYPWHDA